MGASFLSNPVCNQFRVHTLMMFKFRRREGVHEIWTVVIKGQWIKFGQVGSWEGVKNTHKILTSFMDIPLNENFQKRCSDARHYTIFLKQTKLCET